MASSSSILISGRLVELHRPLVMGILNATPDSFYSGSRIAGREEAFRRVRQIVAEGGAIIDVGGYSRRPGAPDVSEHEEWERLRPALDGVREACPDAIVSIDTFRPAIAARSAEQYGVQIINDVSAGEDPEIWDVAASLKMPYVLMHTRGNPRTMATLTQYGDVTAEVIQELSFKLAGLHERGVSDVIIDPGFGFAKTLEQNYELLRNLEAFRLLGCPLLVALSRKSMIYRALDITAEEAANGTTVLHTLALAKGAAMLRVHDVRAAAEAVKLVSLTLSPNSLTR